MKKILLALFVFISISTYAQQDKRLKGIEKDLNAILEVTKAPGFAVAVVQGKKIVYAKGFGYSDYENKVPVDRNTLFAIGSSTKAFTCAILGQLRQEDKLSFDDSPIKYIPELKFYNDEMNDNIIIKDLMSHRTGLPRHDFSWYLFPTDDKDSLIHRIQYQEPFTGVREKWYYNNFMFLAQGVIAERITGKSWEDNIRERFFKPLGMTRSNVSIDEMEKTTNAAIGYDLKGEDEVITKTDYYHIAAMSPAGSINSSVNEMSNWLITWINNGKFKGEEILPASYVNEAMSSHMVIGPNLPGDEFPDLHLANYGYGWMMSSYKGHYRVEHGGNIDGFSANVAFYPSDSIGIVVLTNQNGSSVPGFVRNMMADRMLSVTKTDWAKEFTDRKEKAKKQQDEAKSESNSNKVANTKPSHILQDYTGKYSNPGYGEFNIINRNDSLFANFKLTQWYLKHVHYDVFEPFEVTEAGIDTTDTGPLRLNFSTNDAGDISLVKMKVEGALDHPIEFSHTPNLIDVDKSTLESYVGDYELSGLALKVYIKNENTLYLFVTGQPEYELLPTAKHKFSFKTLEGFKVEFLESDDKSIDEVLVIQPNGTFKAKRK
ncbi:serine hydrolase [Fulvivirga lutimaris]|uniref:serine hydrolase n=1 Tax=Fulvivirga lutimaris TaxID=1819566 RepID=UPI0012BC5DF9|nr:serine hydrolase [Fulvivirga lutimaris]MTI40918.1 serine hydrolase [Fulvivirga lutimaris]